MFCHKCGQQSPEGSAFCQKCGAKLIASGADQQAAPSIPIVPVQPQAPVAQAMNPAKKKSKKLPIILGAVVLAVVIIAIAFGFGGDSIDYVATAKAWEPFAQSQGLPGDCGTIIDKYIEDQKWSTEVEDEIASVTVNGTLKGAEDKVSVTITVAPDETGEGAIFAFSQASINGEQTTDSNEATIMMIYFFTAYNDGDETIDLNAYQQDDLQAVNLSETYTNEAEGISFNYPSGWELITGDAIYDYIDPSEDYVFALLINDAPRPEEQSVIRLCAWPSSQEEIDGLFVSDEEFPAAFDSDLPIEETTVLDTYDGTLVRAISYLEEGAHFYTFMYGRNEVLYRVDFVNTPEMNDTFEPFYTAIMESYTISNTGVSNGSRENEAVDTSYVIGVEAAQRLVEGWLLDNAVMYDALSEAGAQLFEDDTCYLFELAHVNVDTDLLPQYTTILVDAVTGELSAVNPFVEFDRISMDEYRHHLSSAGLIVGE